MASKCTNCSKSALEVGLKHCAKCSVSLYCSRACQRADWKTHKKICGKQADGPSDSRLRIVRATDLSPPKGLESGVRDPFTRLDKGTWLHDRPEKDVFRLLIDAYRLRVEDTYNMDGEVEADSIYDGKSDGLQGFKRFLGRVAARAGMLPPWWNDDKQANCEVLGMTRGQWHGLGCAITKGDIIDYYDDLRFPMQLRMFAEAAYGRGPGGANGTETRQMMMAIEQGRGVGMVASTLDFVSIFGGR